MAAIYPDLENKTVYVTGGASGIGKAIVEAFAAQKAHVIFFDINDSAGNALVNQLGAAGYSAHFFPLDLTDFESLQACFAKA